MNTLGAHHEAVLGIYLKRNGLTPDEIKQVELIVGAAGQHRAGAAAGADRRRRARRHPARQGAGDAAGCASCSPTSTCSARSPPAPTCSPRSSSSENPDTVADLRQRRGARPSSGAARRRARRSSPRSTRSSPSAGATRTPPRSSTGSPTVSPARAAGSPTRSSSSGSTGSPSAASSSQGQVKLADLYTNEFNPFAGGMSDAAIRRVRDVTKRVRACAGPRVPAAAPSSPPSTTSTSTSERGEFLVLVGPERLRQVHAARPARRPDRADARAGSCSTATPITGPGLDRGIVFQQYALLPWRTAQGNVEFGLEANGVPRRERPRAGPRLPGPGRAARLRGPATRTSSPAA